MNLQAEYYKKWDKTKNNQMENQNERNNCGTVIPINLKLKQQN